MLNCNLKLILLLLSLSIRNYNINCVDVTVIGCTNPKENFGQMTVNFIENFYDKLNLNFIGRTPLEEVNFSKNVKNIIENPDKTPGNIALSFGLMHEALLYMPESFIKIAYSYFYSSRIPDQWVTVLNKNFDAVAVPAKFLVKSYKKSGVSIPVFFLPMYTTLKSTESKSISKKRNVPFIFYSIRDCSEHSNHQLLLNAFLNKFNNNKDVLLKLYIKDNIGIKRLYEIINDRNATNVEIIQDDTNKEKYSQLLDLANCYVSVPKSECFISYILEALSMGMPCILSNNTIHKELPSNHLIKLLKSSVKEPADYRFNFGKYIGSHYNILIEELEFALQDVYDNYEQYMQNKDQDVVKNLINKYSVDNLIKKYISLVKPKKIIIGRENKIRKNHIMTNSEELYKKYLLILDKQN